MPHAARRHLTHPLPPARLDVSSGGWFRAAGGGLGGAEERFVDMYLVFADPEMCGPGVRRLAEIVSAAVGASGLAETPADPGQ